MSKPRVAFFDFTSCEGCQLNKLNFEKELLDLLAHVEIVEFREAMDDRSGEYDIAFVEGSISTPACVERIHDIRRRTKLLVALGSCAVNGGINAMKNLHPPEWVKETVYGDDKYLFPSIPVQPLSALVKVDYEVRGCPMSAPEYLHVFKSLLLGRRPEQRDISVCIECKLNENECVLDRGMFCLGPVTRAGCGAICPANGQYCTGCRGEISNLNREGAVQLLKRHGLSHHEAEKRLRMFCAYESA
jgi:sulfhydrogenase subunit delta